MLTQRFSVSTVANLPPCPGGHRPADRYEGGTVYCHPRHPSCLASPGSAWSMNWIQLGSSWWTWAQIRRPATTHSTAATIRCSSASRRPRASWHLTLLHSRPWCRKGEGSPHCCPGQPDSSYCQHSCFSSGQLCCPRQDYSLSVYLPFPVRWDHGWS